MTRRVIGTMLAILICLAARQSVYGAGLSLQLMLQKADSCMERMEYDRALDLYRRVADSYDISLPEHDKLLCLEGIYGCCDINMYKGNYTEAFENLNLAESITEHDKAPDLKLQVRYGAMYIIMTQQTLNAEYLRKTMRHDSIALPKAFRARDDKMIFRAFGDMILSHYCYGILDRMAPYVRRMQEYAATTRSWRPRAALYMYRHAVAMTDRDYSRAAAMYDSALRVVPDVASTARVRASFLKTKAQAEAKAGEAEKALASLRRSMAISDRYRLRDIRLAALQILSDIHRSRGRTDEAERAHVNMLELRDSLRTYAVAEDLHQLELRRERRDMQARMAVAEYRAREKDRWLAGITIFALVILFFLLRLRNRNRRLRQHSALLYERMRQLIAAPAQSPAAEGQQVPPAGASDKYEGSTLTAADKQEIQEAILRVMDSDAIWSPGLTLATFSRRVGRHPKAVSQVIHEEFGCNYSTYINRARIVEACRRVDLPQYANLSMEAIGESVGFNSRTAFSANFRRFTGLGIRAYRQAARQHKKEENKAP